MKKVFKKMSAFLALAVLTLAFPSYAAQTEDLSDYRLVFLSEVGWEISAYYGYSQINLVIPSDEIDQTSPAYPITRIGMGAFEEHRELESVEIPDTVTGIGERAFYSCENLENIVLPNSLTELGFGAFVNCNLKTLTLPESLEIIPNAAFAMNESLESVLFPDGLTAIKEEAFRDCLSLTSVTVPRSVTEIGPHALGYFINSDMYSGMNWIPDYRRIDGFTVYGYSGTAAETYAVQNEFEFIPLDGNVTPGDLDSSGTVGAADIVTLAKHIVDEEAIADDRLYIADVDHDGEVTVKDLMLMVLFVSGKIPALG
ncbi:MAG: leucine-rich repeat protein [Oscillospiraceae bacterium]|jgi:hypothetical protein|nr:leucine-rich repeat protein [Oscillospiraceae bacterium]